MYTCKVALNCILSNFIFISGKLVH